MIHRQFDFHTLNTSFYYYILFVYCCYCYVYKGLLSKHTCYIFVFFDEFIIMLGNHYLNKVCGAHVNCLSIFWTV